MGDKNDVIGYKKTVQRIVDKWSDDTEKKLADDLDSIAEELENLKKIKKPDSDEKKQIVDLHKAARDVAEKRMKTSSTELEKQLNKVKRPDVEELEDQHKKIYLTLTDDLEKGIAIPVPDKFKFGDKKIKLSVDMDDVKGFRIGREF